MNRVARSAVVLLAAVVAAAMLPGGQAGADEEKVVVSRPGTVFHKAGSSDIRGRGVEKGLDAAMAAGYQPCRFCYAKEAGASRLVGASTGTAAVTGLAGNGNGNPPPASAQPQGLQVGSVFGGKRVEGEVKDPYGDLRTIRTPGKEQGAYGDDSYYPGKGGYY